MKKVKIGRTKKFFFSTRIIVLIALLSILAMSSAYALFSETLNLSGNVSGDFVYTYYFLKPSTWSSTGTMHAYIWGNDGTPKSDWPGKDMKFVEDYEGGGQIYKVEIKNTDAYYNTHNMIIFNEIDENGNILHQTLDISVSRSSNNNQLFNTVVHDTSGTKRIFIRTAKTWTKLNVYMWGNNGNNASWPGVEAIRIGDEGAYIEFPQNIYTKIIFNYNGIQTTDLDIPDEQDATFDYTNAQSYRGHWVSGGFYAYGHWVDYIDLPTPSMSHSY